MTIAVHKRHLTKPDGRDLILYARHPLEGAFDAPAPGARGPLASHLRYHPLRGEWIIYAGHRQNRTFLPPPEWNPLAPATDPRHPTEVPAGPWEVAVFENLFSALGTSEGTEATAPSTIVETKPCGGRTEVVVFTQDPKASLGSLPLDRIELVLAVWADRTATLARRGDVEYVFAFENRGVEVGVTLHHPHGQIYAYPFVTPRTRVMLDSARRHRERTGRDLFADRLDAELADGARVVTTSEHWVAFVPFAARWPVEVHLYPRHRVPDLPALDDDVRDDFPEIYLRVLKTLDGLYDNPLPYISGWHQAPVRTDRELASLHLEVFSVKRAADKLKFLAGSESGMGAFVNDIAPERTAAMLREQLPR
jgi:UDPglucose--hexose-1-phosphate uridylyltransferase